MVNTQYTIRDTQYAILANHRLSTVLCPLQLSRILYKSALFMQNKANFLDAQMNVNSILTKDYERNDIFAVPENKANTKPNKANLQNAQMNVTVFYTKEYENKSNWAICENKANSNPISVKPKMDVNLYVIEDYENETTLSPQKNKPNQSQFQTRSEAEIPTGELLGILKPGTNFERGLAKMGHHE